MNSTRIFPLLVCFMLAAGTVFSSQQDAVENITVFSENLEGQGVYTYVYPENVSSLDIMCGMGYGSNKSLRVLLHTGTYSGAAVGFLPYNFSPVVNSTNLEFWIRGRNGGEKVYVNLADDEVDQIKCETTLPLNPYFIKLTQEWQKVSIPLSYFSNFGTAYNEGIITQEILDWGYIQEIKFSTVPDFFGIGRPIEFYVDEIRFVTSPENTVNYAEKVSLGEILKQEVSDKGAALGVYRDGLPGKMESAAEFEQFSGKKAAIITWYRDWSKEYPADAVAHVRENGYTPHIVWEPVLYDRSKRITLQDIIDGKWDEYIVSWAEAVRDLGMPVMITWAHEFNGSWYPWGIAHNGRDPERYVKAWRHIHDIFSIMGADTVSWVWAVNHESYPLQDWNDITKAYPGDEYVDILSITGYNRGDRETWSSWVSFEELFSPVYRIFTEKYPGKPIVINEFSCSESGGDKAEWFRQISKTLPEHFPEIKALTVFDVIKEDDFRITSSAEATEGFREAMASPYILSEAPPVLLKSGQTDIAAATALQEGIPDQTKVTEIVSRLKAAQSIDDTVEALHALAKLYYEVNAFSAFRDLVSGLSGEKLAHSAYLSYILAQSYDAELGALIAARRWTFMRALMEKNIDRIAAYASALEADGTSVYAHLLTEYVYWSALKRVYSIEKAQKASGVVRALVESCYFQGHPVDVYKDFADRFLNHGDPAQAVTLYARYFQERAKTAFDETWLADFSDALSAIYDKAEAGPYNALITSLLDIIFEQTDLSERTDVKTFLFDAAERLYGSGLFESAVDIYGRLESALSLDTFTAGQRLLYAESFLWSGTVVRALEMLAKLTVDAPGTPEGIRAADVLSLTSRLDIVSGDMPGELLSLAEALFREQRFQEANRIYSVVFGMLGLKRAGLIPALDFAESLFWAGEYDQAVELYDGIIAMYPTMRTSRMARQIAALYRHITKGVPISDAYDKAAYTAGSALIDRAVLSDTARGLYKSSLWSAAAKTYASILTIYGADSLTAEEYFLYGESLLYSGRLRLARDVLKTVTTLFADSVQAGIAQAYLDYTRLVLKDNAWDGGKALMTALTLRNSGKYGMAAVLYQLAEKKAGMPVFDASSLLDYGESLVKAGYRADALTVFAALSDTYAGSDEALRGEKMSEAVKTSSTQPADMMKTAIMKIAEALYARAKYFAAADAFAYYTDIYGFSALSQDNYMAYAVSLFMSGYVGESLAMFSHIAALFIGTETGNKALSIISAFNTILDNPLVVPADVYDEIFGQQAADSDIFDGLFEEGAIFADLSNGLALANLLHSQGHYFAAAVVYATLDEKFGTYSFDPQSHLNYADSLLQSGNTGAAMNQYGGIVEKHGGTIQAEAAQRYLDMITDMGSTPTSTPSYTDMYEPQGGRDRIADFVGMAESDYTGGISR